MNPVDEQDPLAGLRLDERAGPARRISRDQGQSMVEQALATWAEEQPVRGRRWAVLRSVATAAAILLAVVGGASAARWYYGPRLPSHELTAQEPAARASRSERHAAVDSSPPRGSQERVDPDRSEASAAKPAQVAPAPTALATPKTHRSSAHERAEPEDLLQRANRLRAEGRFQAAAETYALVYDRYPRSLSAYAARVAAGSIQLEHLGKPNKARKLFEGALRSHPGGALDLEARQGLALSLRDMGRNNEEREALRALVKSHGESPAARRAEERLTELTALPSPAREPTSSGQ